MVQSGARQHADAAMLATGRSLFVGRCAHCHALPAVAEHTAQQWPGIVEHMSKRSGLKPDQSRAVLAYLLAARQQ
jgi:mono/diheme cytochrome c family protein